MWRISIAAAIVANEKQKCISWKRKCRNEFIEFVMAIVVPIRISSHEFSPLNFSSVFCIESKKWKRLVIELSNHHHHQPYSSCQGGGESWFSFSTTLYTKWILVSFRGIIIYYYTVLYHVFFFSFSRLISYFNEIRPYNFCTHKFALNWREFMVNLPVKIINFHFVLVHEKSVQINMKRLIQV